MQKTPMFWLKSYRKKIKLSTTRKKESSNYKLNMKMI